MVIREATTEGTTSSGFTNSFSDNFSNLNNWTFTSKRTTSHTNPTNAMKLGVYKCGVQNASHNIGIVHGNLTFNYDVVRTITGGYGEGMWLMIYQDGKYIGNAERGKPFAVDGDITMTFSVDHDPKWCNMGDHAWTYYTISNLSVKPEV